MYFRKVHSMGMYTGTQHGNKNILVYDLFPKFVKFYPMKKLINGKQ